MRLESDPTVIYGIPDFDGNLRRRDLENADNAYNTYRHPGLPPGPIANPGRAALEAVANPSRTNDLFFVADGTGGHVFAETLEEHNRNVARWRQIERDRKAAAEAAGQGAGEQQAGDGQAATGTRSVQRLDEQRIESRVMGIELGVPAAPR